MTLLNVSPTANWYNFHAPYDAGHFCALPAVDENSFTNRKTCAIIEVDPRTQGGIAMKKEPYIRPEMEICEFAAEDIITTSSEPSQLTNGGADAEPESAAYDELFGE